MARGRHKVTVEQLIEQYVFALSDRRCAEATLRWHRYHLTKVAEWANQRAATPYPVDWERDDQNRHLVRRYLSEVGLLAQPAPRRRPDSLHARYRLPRQQGLRPPRCGHRVAGATGKGPRQRS